jgi:hypothetical protein
VQLRIIDEVEGVGLGEISQNVGKRGLRAADQVAVIPSLWVSSCSQVFGRPRMFACVGRAKIDTEPAQPSAKSKPLIMIENAPGRSKPLRYAAIPCPFLVIRLYCYFETSASLALECRRSRKNKLGDKGAKSLLL